MCVSASKMQAAYLVTVFSICVQLFYIYHREARVITLRRKAKVKVNKYAVRKKTGWSDLRCLNSSCIQKGLQDQYTKLPIYYYGK